MVEFPDYPTMLVRMLNQCIREPHVHLAVFIMMPTGEARLDFIQVRGCAGPRASGPRRSEQEGGCNRAALARGGLSLRLGLGLRPVPRPCAWVARCMHVCKNHLMHVCAWPPREP